MNLDLIIRTVCWQGIGGMFQKMTKIPFSLSWLNTNFHFTLLYAYLMPRSHIHGVDAGGATEIIRGNPYWSVAFRIASVTIRSNT